MVNLFLSSTEFLTDLVSNDFLADLGRPPTPTDTAAFLKAAQSGVSSPTLEAIVLGASLAARA